MADPDLELLGAIAADVAADWGVVLGDPFALSRFSYVAPAGADFVLKVTPSGDDESDQEADALEIWNGHGAVLLLRHDRARRAMLLERARPGTDLSELADDEATAIAVEVGLRLWRPATDVFRWIGDHVPRWLDRAERSEQQGSDLVPLARELYGSLDVGRDVLVHGDLHHHNILRAGERYVAIDAKAMRGEPEYDVPSFLRNPIGRGYRIERETTERRLAAFAAAGLDEGRMRTWALIRCAYLGADENEAVVLRALVRDLV
jgi:streptomycin 6-kinase